MKKLFIILLGIFLFSFIIPLGSSAICSNNGLPTQQQDTTFDLIQQCDSCTFVNLSSVTFPNGTTLNYDLFMTKTGTTYNFTFNQSSDIGSYFYSVIGDKDGGLIEETICFEITQTGRDLDTPQGIIIVGLFFILFLISIAFFYGGENTEYRPVKIFLTSLGWLFLMFIVGIAVNVVQQLLTVVATLEGTFSILYTLMLILTSAWGIGLIVYIIYMSMRQFYAHRGLVDDFDDD